MATTVSPDHQDLPQEDRTVRPYGAWSSPIDAELITAQSVGLGAAMVDGGRFIWAEARPERGGQISLVQQSGRPTESATESATEAGTEAGTELVGDPFSVRTRVHEYGGGAWAATDRLLVFSNYADNRLYRLELDTPGAQPVALSPDEPGLRYAALSIVEGPDLPGWPRGMLLAVREDHRDDDAEPTNTVVALALDPGDPRNSDGGQVLCSGADFYADPAMSGDGRLAWVEWDHPAMPWDATRLRVGVLDPTGEALEQIVQLAGGDQEAALHPGWTPAGDLIFISDRTEWWNLYRSPRTPDGTLGPATSIYPKDAEFCRPAWMLGDHPYLILDDDRLICGWSENNIDQLGLLRIGDRRLVPIETGAVSIGGLHTDGRTLVAALGYRDRSRTLSCLDLTDLGLDEVEPGDAGLDAVKPDDWRVFARSTDRELPNGLISRAEPVTWSGDAGPVHAWFYPPTNAAYRAPDGELPPMITVSHGGPTSASAPAFNLGLQYWTSRGFAVLDVNYSGSTGYGRPYRERLRGQWGLVDVGDCATGALAMVERGRADRARLAIRGGSAGGYTTLRALTATDVFTAGISLYGIGDLEILARDSHKFESRYLDSMVGPYPEQVDVYHDRSPIYHLDQLSAPILLLQGREDKVVPPNQAEMFADAARDKGLPVALIMYDGEGHGFRRPENIRSSLEASLSFLGRVFGFTPADELAPIEIDNLA